MSVRLHVHHALDRVTDERRIVSEKQDAYTSFDRTVRDIPARTPSSQPSTRSPAGGGMGTTGVLVSSSGSRGTTNGCRRVRDAFAETVRPYAVDDGTTESVITTIGEELGSNVATAVAPRTNSAFTGQVQTAVCNAIAERQTELEVLERALDAEAESLGSAAQILDSIIDWLVDANEDALTDLGFDTLHDRHRTLDDHRTACNRAARTRQHHLAGTTKHGAAIGIGHRSLADYLYANHAVDYPVLETCARLDRVCEDCQRIIRRHLVTHA